MLEPIQTPPPNLLRIQSVANAHTIQTPPPNLLRIQSVMARTGLNSKSSIYAAIAKGTFPKPIKLGVRSVAWTETSINDFIAERIQAAKKEA